MKEQNETYLTIPNQLTALRILLVPVFVVLLLQVDPYLKLLGVIVFVVASLTDIYDGYHARKYGVTTRLGAFLDPLADKLLITAAFFLYVGMGFLSLWMVILVVVIKTRKSAIPHDKSADDSPLLALLTSVKTLQFEQSALVGLVPEFEKLRSKLPSELLSDGDPFRPGEEELALLREEVKELLMAKIGEGVRQI